VTYNEIKIRNGNKMETKMRRGKAREIKKERVMFHME
jgi:hypothetical protein